MHVFKAPNFVDINITRNCNFACTHCYIGESKKQDLSLEDGLKYIDDLTELGTFKIAIAGGEPLLHRNWNDFLDRIITNGLSAILNTNGVLLNDNNLNKITSIKNINRNNFILAISLDGLKNRGFGKIRKWSDGKSADDTFDLIIKNANDAIDRGIKTVFNFTFSGVNYTDLFDLYDYLIAKVGEKRFILNVILFGVSGRGIGNKDDLSVDYYIWKEYLNKIYNKKLNNELRYMTVEPSCPWEIYLPLYEYGIKKIEEIIKYSSILKSSLYRETRRIGCNAGITNIAINGDGKVSACGLYATNQNFIIGDLTKSKIADIWNNSYKLNSIRNISIKNLSKTCQNCKLTSICGGGCRGFASLKNNSLFDDDTRCPFHSSIRVYDYAKN